jgi:hypothetical protein
MPTLPHEPSKFRRMLKLEHGGFFRPDEWQESDFIGQAD